MAALIVVGAIVTIVAAVSIVPSGGDAERAGCDTGLGTPGTLTVHDAPCPPPGRLTFADGSGQPLTLADFRGTVVLVNLWATWCPPCVKEMPALDALQAKLGGPDFAVVAISQDRGGVTLPQAFLEGEGLRNLGLYVDPDGTATQALKAPGLPTSVLFDRDGNEIARLVGPAEWDSEEMVAKIKELGGLDPS